MCRFPDKTESFREELPGAWIVLKEKSGPSEFYQSLRGMVFVAHFAAQHQTGGAKKAGGFDSISFRQCDATQPTQRIGDAPPVPGNACLLHGLLHK